MLHRKIQGVGGHLIKNSVMIRKLRKDLKKVNERAASSAAHYDDLVGEMKREIQVLSHQLEGSPSRTLLPKRPLQRDVETEAGLEDFCAANQDIDEEIDRNLVQNNSNTRHFIQSLQSELDELRNDFVRLRTGNEIYMTADMVGACRWLLEHLPAKNPIFGNGERWRRFWQKEWENCKKKKRKSHPLCKLNSDEKFNSAGKKLYGTLSDRLHKYGDQRGEQLDPHSQRVLDAIKPVHYDVDGKIDLKAERKRWSG